jgi:hypothetical protein
MLGESSQGYNLRSEVYTKVGLWFQHTHVSFNGRLDWMRKEKHTRQKNLKQIIRKTIFKFISSLQIHEDAKNPWWVIPYMLARLSLKVRRRGSTRKTNLVAKKDCRPNIIFLVIIAFVTIRQMKYKIKSSDKVVSSWTNNKLISARFILRALASKKGNIIVSTVNNILRIV